MQKSSPSAPANKPTLTEIADAHGYSLSTVSKVLNGYSDVSSQTRKKLGTILRESGYTLTSRTRRTSNTIEVVSQTVDNMWSLEILRGIIKTSSSMDYSIVLTESQDRLRPNAGWIDDVIRRRPHGIILIFSDLIPTERERLNSMDIPYVILDPATKNMLTDSHSVQADNWTGGILATQHLLSLGHRKIGIITGPLSIMCSQARLDGYKTALSKTGVEFDPNLVREGDFLTPGGKECAMSLLTEEHPTAIFACNDLQALGVYEAARQLGIRIPEDLSVVGFDDLQMTEIVSPPLTTVRQPLEEMGSTATEMIINFDKRMPHAIQSRILPTTLVRRKSTRELSKRFC